jgi:hypothetical protein
MPDDIDTVLVEPLNTVTREQRRVKLGDIRRVAGKRDITRYDQPSHHLPLRCTCTLASALQGFAQLGFLRST